MGTMGTLEARLARSARRWLPDGAVGWLKRQRNAWRLHRRQQLRAQLIANHGTFTAAQLVAACREAGIRENGVLFVQCSLNDLLTYGEKPYELLRGLHELVGPRGTLVMPAYTTNMAQVPCRLFDVRREPTYTGLIPEFFRREKGVLRSLHPRHSMCAFGPAAAELLAGHEDCVYADGPESPFDRIRKRDDAQSLCLGMYPGWHSFLHWVEDIEPGKFPVPVHDGPHECALRDAEGKELRRPFYRSTDRVHQEWVIGKNLGASAMHALEFHGVPICIYSWPAFATELLALRDRGIIWYV